MDGSRRLIRWSGREVERGRASGLRVFGSVGGELADHLSNALQSTEANQRVAIPRALALETIKRLRAIAAETPSPYVVSFVTMDDWQIEMRLAVQSGRLIVSELHIKPRQRDNVPPGGITARALRRVPLHAGVAGFTSMLRASHRRDEAEILLKDTGLEEVLSAQFARSRSTPKGAGRRALPDEILLEVAAAYVQAVDAGSAQPVVDAAKALNMKMVRARDLIYKARQRGLLTPTSWGLASGELTPQAKELLKSRRRRRRTSRRGRGASMS
jgi:hypothetical protein